MKRIDIIVLIVVLPLVVVAGCATLKPAARTTLEHGDEICILLPEPEEQEICGNALEIARLLVAIADRTAELRDTADAQAEVELELQTPAPTSTGAPLPPVGTAANPCGGGAGGSSQ